MQMGGRHVSQDHMNRSVWEDARSAAWPAEEMACGAHRDGADLGWRRGAAAAGLRGGQRLHDAGGVHGVGLDPLLGHRAPPGCLQRLRPSHRSPFRCPQSPSWRRFRQSQQMRESTWSGTDCQSAPQSIRPRAAEVSIRQVPQAPGNLPAVLRARCPVRLRQQLIARNIAESCTLRVRPHTHTCTHTLCVRERERRGGERHPGRNGGKPRGVHEEVRPHHCAVPQLHPCTSMPPGWRHNALHLQPARRWEQDVSLVACAPKPWAPCGDWKPEPPWRCSREAGRRGHCASGRLNCNAVLLRFQGAAACITWRMPGAMAHRASHL